MCVCLLIGISIDYLIKPQKSVLKYSFYTLISKYNIQILLYCSDILTIFLQHIKHLLNTICYFLKKLFI